MYYANLCRHLDVRVKLYFQQHIRFDFEWNFSA